MEFDLIAFTLHPTTEVFECCRKVDLLLIADFFDISVPRETSKRTTKQVLRDRFVETGIVPEATTMEDVSPDVGLGDVSDRALPNVDPVLAIKMKELDLLINQEERETLLVKLHLIEAETDQACRLQQFKYQDLKDRPVPVTESGVYKGSPVFAAERPTSPLLQTEHFSGLPSDLSCVLASG